MSDTREYFNQVAPEWDAMRTRFFGEGVRRAAITIFLAQGTKPAAQPA